jgi:hypothetical protein
MLGFSAGITVLDEHVLALEVGKQSVKKICKMGLINPLIDRAPPNLVQARRLFDDEPVFRRSAHVMPGPHDHRTQMGDISLSSPDDLLIEMRRSGVPV